MKAPTLPPVVALAAVAWVIVGVARLGLIAMDSHDGLLSLVVFAPFLLLALWSAVLLARGGSRRSVAAWAVVAAALGVLASVPVLSTVPMLRGGGASWDAAQTAIVVSNGDVSNDLQPADFVALAVGILSVVALVVAVSPRRSAR